MTTTELSLPTDPMVDAIVDLIAPAVRAAGLDPAGVRCELIEDGPGLDVHLQLGGIVTTSAQHAIGVRVLDAVRSTATHTYGNVDVYVHPTRREVTTDRLGRG